MNSIRVITEKCIGCRLCEKACPFDAIHVVEKKAVINEKCTICGACVDACKKYGAIVIERRVFKPAEAATAYSGICVYAEHRAGKLASVVSEIVGAARSLKESLGKPISAILLGHGVRPIAEELLSLGVDEVWMMDHPGIGDLAEDVQTELVAKIIQERKPEIFLGGGTIIGRSMLPRVAARILTGLTADCTELDIDGKRSCCGRPAPPSAATSWPPSSATCTVPRWPPCATR